MRRLALAVLFVWCACLSSAHAVFIKTQMETIDHEPLFDSEYFADILSFSAPAEWDELWRGSTATAYRINSASLDCCDLLLQQELRLQKRLVDGLDFRFRLIQQEDKERQDLHYRLEFEKSLGWGFSALAFGEPTFRKEDSDIGFGLAWERGWLKAAARHNFVDFNFNQRGSTTQRYSRKPATDDFTVEFAPAERRFWASLELDHPLRREIPDENRVFSYRRTTLTLGAGRDPRGGWSRRLEYGYEFQRKGNLFNPDPGTASIENLRRVHRVLAAAEGPLTERDRLEAGQALLVRAARTDNVHDPQAGIFHRRWEAQPYARWRRTVKPWLLTELATFLTLGENRRRFAAEAAPSAYGILAEAKLGAGVDFLFGPSGRIGLYGTFDLDSPAHPWDGGNMRAMFFF